MCIVDGYAYSTWIRYNVRLSQSQCNMHTASYKFIDHVKALRMLAVLQSGTPAYIVSFAEDFFVHAYIYIYEYQRHLVNLVPTVPNILHFRSEDVKIMFFFSDWLIAEV